MYIVIFAVNEFLTQEGPALLEMRIRHLIKGKRFDQATKLAKVCAEHPEIGTKSIFKQTYLTCLCTSSSSEILMDEVSMTKLLISSLFFLRASSLKKKNQMTTMAYMCILSESFAFSNTIFKQFFDIYLQSINI